MPQNLIWDNACVLPIYKETYLCIDNFINTFSANDSSILLILIINQPNTENDSKPQDLLNNLIQKKFIMSWENGHLSLFNTSTNIDLLIIDRFTRPIPFRAGVGLARKIGMDICCKLSHQKKLNCHFVGTTDADTLLPSNYFAVMDCTSSNYSAICFNYKHIGINDMVTSTTLWYEASLRFYQAGLKYAQSSYSFHTIGSCMAINLLSYAKVRGFPRRAAGEDFYLLNKLRKISPIHENVSCIIKIQSRLSDRVPFGTGPKVNSLLEKMTYSEDCEKTSNEFTSIYYDKRVFDSLKLCLQGIHSYQNSLADFPVNSYPESTALVNLGFKDFQEHCRTQGLSVLQSQHQFFIWFDAFKQLKYIHFITDHFYPKQKYSTESLSFYTKLLWS